MKKSNLFKKLGILLLMGQSLLGVPMMAQENSSETTARTTTVETTERTDNYRDTSIPESEVAYQRESGTTESNSTTEANTDNRQPSSSETTEEILDSNTDSKSVAQQQVFTEEDYKQATALELAKLVREKKVTSEELVKIAVKITKRENPTLNAVITLREEAALTEAKALKDTG